MPRKKKLPPNVRRHGSGFRAVLTIHGKRVRSRVLVSPEAAVAWIDAYRDAEAKPVDRPLVMTLAAGLELVNDELRATGARDATFVFYRNRARPLLRLIGESRELHTITRADVESFAKARARAGVKPATYVGKELFILRRVLRLARAAGYPLPTDPFAGVRLPRAVSDRMEALTKAQMADVVARIRASSHQNAEWHADVVEALFGTGLRRAEFGRLRVQDIDFAGGFLRVDGKTGARHQTFAVSLESVMRRLVKRARKSGHLVSARFVQEVFAHWKRKLGLRHFSPHVARHSYATAMADHVPQLQLMYLMGHKTLQMSSRYYHGRGEAVRTALDALRLGPPTPPPAADAAKPETPDR